ncbi:ABC transporter permease [Photobacterium sp. DA100]|uniref:ABC transporter permease n=1 Tax=Photobacterium sp. DA100 TaxID=3027472 RepID=UPI0024785EEB|nr:ABC transporter permease [Photobacterium sp. DA100]WEM41189.1 ABC transporter permease [Photobacterium sp. DA100]
MSEINRQALKQQTLIIVQLTAVFVFFIVYCIFYPTQGQGIDLQLVLQPPTWSHWFGTDVMGRDMWGRTLKGLLLSLQIGGGAAVLSGLIAMFLTVIAGLNRRCEWGVALLVDMFMAIPHLLLLIILTLALGGSMSGVIWAVALTHWPKLTRLLVEEQRGLLMCQFVQLAGQFGRPKWTVLWHHVLPFILPHCLIGILLMIPHALVHVSGLTFLGFGLEPTTPSIGILLSEASRYMLSGNWWLALFPGVVLLVVLLWLSAIGQACVRFAKIKGY